MKLKDKNVFNFFSFLFLGLFNFKTYYKLSLIWFTEFLAEYKKK